MCFIYRVFFIAKKLRNAKTARFCGKVFFSCSGNAPAFPEVLISGGRPKISYNPTPPEGRGGLYLKN